MSRRNARENVYILTFEFLFSKEKNDTTLELMLMDTSLTDEDKQYITSTYDGVIAHFDELKALIAKYVEGYAVDRIFKPDLAVMLVCTYELKYATDIPAAVSISEAVEIAKKYSSEKSKAFVNGTMASIYKEIIGGNPV